mgnify:CR=1 FL=1
MSENGNGKENIVLTFPDGRKSNHPLNITPAGILQQIGPPLSKKSIAANFNDIQIDLSKPLDER